MAIPKVIVTGFGPFNEHQINASWAAVQILPNLNIEGIELIIEEIPVSYEIVEKRIKEIWEEHSPSLVIHVGVSKKADKINIERVANRTGYIKKDCCGEEHPTGECSPSGEDVITCDIDVIKICEALNNDNIISCVSEDAGRFLCEFIFYKSLTINRKRTMFVHVPLLDKPYTANELAAGLKRIIEEAMKQLNNCSI